MLPPTSYWFAKDDTEDSFADVAYAEKHTLDFTAPAQGDYLIIATGMASNSATSNKTWVRVQLNDTTTLMVEQREPQVASNTEDYRSFGTVYLAESLASGAHYVDIDAYVSGGTGYLRYLKIAVIRLDDWLSTSGMYATNAGEAGVDFTDTGADVLTLQWTPDATGDYLVLVSSCLLLNNTSKSAWLYLDWESATELIPLNNPEETIAYVTIEPHDTTDVWGAAWAGIVNAASTAQKTIILKGDVSGGTATASYNRILVLRLAAMSAEEDEVVAVTSTAGQWTDKGTLTFTPGGTYDYLLLGTMNMKPDTADDGYTRMEHTTGTGTGTIAQMNVFPKDYSGYADSLPFLTAEVKELADISQTFKTQYGYGTASATMYGKASTLVAVPLEAAAPAGGELQLLVDGGVIQLLVDDGVIQKIVD